FFIAASDELSARDFFDDGTGKASNVLDSLIPIEIDPNSYDRSSQAFVIECFDKLWQSVVAEFLQFRRRSRPARGLWIKPVGSFLIAQLVDQISNPFVPGHFLFRFARRSRPLFIFGHHFSKYVGV